MYNIDGAQDSAEWFGLRELPTDTGKFTDSLPYYIGVNINILSWTSATYFGIKICGIFVAVYEQSYMFFYTFKIDKLHSFWV